ncbi:MAG: aconitate hydratase AcnA [Gammaproteobacteria bacterium]
MVDSFNTRQDLTVNDKVYEIFNLNLIDDEKVRTLPYSLKILLENLLRFEDGINIKESDIKALINWDPQATPDKEISFTPARVILQDFTGVPAVVDLAAMREAVTKMGGDASKINPLSPAELVIDHSVQVDNFGSEDALKKNTEIEFERNNERYSFLKWGQQAFDNFKVVPPSTGIVHQVNLEYLSRVVFNKSSDGKLLAYPDTLVGTDSHTTMINGLGIVGWGVGGIEAEAAMLGQPITMLIPQVIGFKLSGQLPEGSTATDLVLTVTEILRKYGVVGKFVEFFGPGLSELPLADRATLGNMSPEFGSTCAVFPIDDETISYLSLSGREQDQIDLVEQYAKATGLWGSNEDARYSDVIELNMSDIVPSLAGPKRPQDRILLSAASQTFNELTKDSPTRDHQGKLKDGDVLIAAITSCTNTSNPAVMVAAGLLAQKANQLGLKTKPWVKTSLAPGSKVVSDYLKEANLLGDLEGLGFNIVGYGCTTCIGNSGPLPSDIESSVRDEDIVSCSVVSGNRNFEGRIHPLVKMNFLASPPLVVAYALAGNLKIDLLSDAIGQNNNGEDVYLKDIWPSAHEVQNILNMHINANMFNSSYQGVFDGDDNWQSVNSPKGQTYSWDNESTYVKNPPYFDGMTDDLLILDTINQARVLAKLGDSVTTDHISPAGSIAKDSPAAIYLRDRGVADQDFNSYGSRRGNHEVMMRGTFANIRLKNQLLDGVEGGYTLHIPSGKQMPIFDASEAYRQSNTPLIILGGKEYGSGSSRDWAAKGTKLLGVSAVIAESYERIHRSNLIGMGVLPLQYLDGQNAASLGISGFETFNISNIKSGESKLVNVEATSDDGSKISFDAKVRIDTPKEIEYFQHGGILQYVLRQLIRS